jgi:hypothetical protein
VTDRDRLGVVGINGSGKSTSYSECEIRSDFCNGVHESGLPETCASFDEDDSASSLPNIQEAATYRFELALASSKGERLASPDH